MVVEPFDAHLAMNHPPDSSLLLADVGLRVIVSNRNLNRYLMVPHNVVVVLDFAVGLAVVGVGLCLNFENIFVIYLMN